MSLTYLCSVPKLIYFNYVMIIRVMQGTFEVLHLAQVLECSEGFIFLALPPILTELIKNEIEQIKKILSRQLIRCSDESLRFELQIAVEYVTRRPFEFVILNTVTLDISMLIGIVSICITYIIVVMQFTYLNKTV